MFLSTGITVAVASRLGSSKPGVALILMVRWSSSPRTLGYLMLFLQDYAEIIPWAADQPWSTGKVGLAGISYLGSNQVRCFGETLTLPKSETKTSEVANSGTKASRSSGHLPLGRIWGVLP